MRLPWGLVLVQSILLVATPHVSADTIALSGGMLLDGYEAPPIHDPVVIIKDNKIVAAGPSHKVPIPDYATIIDTRGKTILPGLIDAHIHLDLIGHGSYDRYYEFIGGTRRLPEVMPIAAKQMLRAGITSAIDLGSPFQILEVKRKIESGEIPGPRLTISGPWLTRVYLDGVPDDYQVLISSPSDARKKTLQLINQGSDVIKTWVGLTKADYQAIVEAAHSKNVKVHAHLYQPDAIQDAIDAGVDVFQHVGSARNPPYSDDLVAQIAHKNIPIVQTISHRIWVYPRTIAFPTRLDNEFLQRDIPKDIYQELQASFENIHHLSYFSDIGLETRNAAKSASQFIEANAMMGVGTDAASPLNFHTEAIWIELGALVDSGMTPIQALSAATKTNAEILGQFHELGSVEAGKLADLIVVDGDVTTQLGSIPRVEVIIKNGDLWYQHTQAESVLATGREL